jgi:hypothetical protein
MLLSKSSNVEDASLRSHAACRARVIKTQPDLHVQETILAWPRSRTRGMRAREIGLVILSGSDCYLASPSHCVDSRCLAPPVGMEWCVRDRAACSPIPCLSRSSRCYRAIFSLHARSPQSSTTGKGRRRPTLLFFLQWADRAFPVGRHSRSLSILQPLILMLVTGSGALAWHWLAAKAPFLQAPPVHLWRCEGRSEPQTRPADLAYTQVLGTRTFARLR